MNFCLMFGSFKPSYDVNINVSMALPNANNSDFFFLNGLLFYVSFAFMELETI